MKENAMLRLSPSEASFIEGVYRDYAVGLYKYLRVYIEHVPDDDIYDCVQDTFIIAMKKVKEFIMVSNVGGWIFRTAILNGKNFIRKRRYERRMVLYKDIGENDIVDYVSAEQRAIEKLEPEDIGFFDKMHKLFISMNDEEKQIYSYLINKTDYKTIAVKMGISINRAYYLCRKLRERILSCFR